MPQNPLPRRPFWPAWIGVGLFVVIILLLLHQVRSAVPADQERLVVLLVLQILFGGSFCTAFAWQRVVPPESPLHGRLQTLALVAAGSSFMMVLFWSGLIR